MQQPISYYTAVGVLVAFKNKQLTIDEEVFDTCVDTLVELLEQTNNEKYRLVNRRPRNPEG